MPQWRQSTIDCMPTSHLTIIDHIPVFKQAERSLSPDRSFRLTAALHGVMEVSSSSCSMHGTFCGRPHIRTNGMVRYGGIWHRMYLKFSQNSISFSSRIDNEIRIFYCERYLHDFRFLNGRPFTIIVLVVAVATAAWETNSCNGVQSLSSFE